MSELIAPPYAPPAASPYSPGLLTGDWIFLSGQGGFDPDTGELVSDDVAGLTAQVFRNVEVLLRAAGASLDDIVSCLVHLSDLAQVRRVQRQLRKAVPGPGKAGAHHGWQRPGGRNAGGSDSSRTQARPCGKRCDPRGQVRNACPLPPCPPRPACSWPATRWR